MSKRLTFQDDELNLLVRIIEDVRPKYDTPTIREEMAQFTADRLLAKLKAARSVETLEADASSTSIADVEQTNGGTHD